MVYCLSKLFHQFSERIFIVLENPIYNTYKLKRTVHETINRTTYCTPVV